MTAPDYERTLPVPQHNRAKSSSAVLSSQSSLQRSVPAPTERAHRVLRETNGNVQSVPILPPGQYLPTTSDADCTGPSYDRQAQMPALKRRSKSAVSLRSLVSSGTEPKKSKDKSDRSPKKPKKEKKIPKTKSSTGLSTMFAKLNRSSKNLAHDSENDYPDRSLTDDTSRRSGSPTERPMSGFVSGTQRVRTDRPSSRPGRPKSLIVTAKRELSDILSRQGSADRSQLSSRGSDTSCASRDAASASRFSIDRFRTAESDRRKASDSSAEHSAPNRGLFVGKRGSRVMAAVAAIDGKHKQATEQKPRHARLDPAEVEQAFEAVLISRNIPEDQRQKMRTLTIHIKADFVRQDQIVVASSPTKSTSASDNQRTASDGTPAITPPPSKRGRPRSKTLTLSKLDKPDTKRQKSASRPLSVNGSDSLQKGLSALLSSPPIHAQTVTNTPDQFVAYLRSAQDPTEAEVGRIHKLRLLLRNETVAWVHEFIELGGMAEVGDLLHRIMAIEWREDHEDQLLHETLLCLKGLCTTDYALQTLDDMADRLLPPLLHLVFDEERKGPSEFSTRGIIFSIIFAYLGAELKSTPADLEKRARKILSYLEGPEKPQDTQAISFVLDMRARRPYCVWCKEITNVLKEVFWIFLHHSNIINVSDAEDQDQSPVADTYAQRRFPRTRPPTPAAPYIGGVEWDATNYLANHLDLVSGLIASLPTMTARNSLRADLRASGFEKIMGENLRTCKEKFYPYVHDALRDWIAAAEEDGWDTAFVRTGPSLEQRADAAVRQLHSPSRKPLSPEKEAELRPPRLDVGLADVPQLDLGLRFGAEKNSAPAAQLRPVHDAKAAEGAIKAADDAGSDISWLDDEQF